VRNGNGGAKKPIAWNEAIRVLTKEGAEMKAAYLIEGEKRSKREKRSLAVTATV